MWLVRDEFMYNGSEYRFIVEHAEEGTINTLEDIENIRIGFLKHMGNNEYVEVDDKDEMDAVSQIVVERLMPDRHS